MKLKYLLPFLCFPLFPNEARAQVKLEANKYSVDVKSPWFDLSARDTFGLDKLVNTRGVTRFKFRNNSIYAIRNGVLNHLYGGNLDAGFVGGYYNRSEQEFMKETHTEQPSLIGPIKTSTRITNDNSIRDLGLSLKFDNSFVSYESATKENSINGSTTISIAENQSLVPFSSGLNSRSQTYSVGFNNGFIQVTRNAHQITTEKETQDPKKFNTFLIKTNYSILLKEEDKIETALYYGGNAIDFPRIWLKDISGFVDFNLGFFNLPFLRQINASIFYNGREDSSKFSFGLSTRRRSRLNQGIFEEELEGKLRAVPRIYNSELEINKDFLDDMFFTRSFFPEFSVSIDEHGRLSYTINLNLKYVLGHYSEEKKGLGIKLGPFIGTWDFDRREARAGMFLGRIKH